MLDQYGVKGATNLEIFNPNLRLSEDLSFFNIPTNTSCFQQIDKVFEGFPQLKLNQYTDISPPVNQRKQEGNLQNRSAF